MYFAVVAHTLAFKTEQKKNKHLILHIVAHRGKKQLPDMQSTLKMCFSQVLQPVLSCRKQALEGNRHNS